MLTISKKTLSVYRTVMYIGFAVFILGAIMTVTQTPPGLLIALAGIVAAAVGAYGMDRLYRCPNCGKKLLNDGSNTDALMEKCPKYCPHCGMEIKVEIK